MTDHTDITGTTTTEPNLATRWEVWDDGGLPAAIAPRLTALGLYTPDAVAIADTLADQLAQLLDQRTAVTAVDRFLAAATDHDDYCNRYATLRTVERLSQITDPAIPRAPWQHPDPHARRRVLTGVEIGLVRYFASMNAKTTALVGAFDSGATTGELAKIISDHVLLDGKTTAINLAGTERDGLSGFTAVRPRTRDIAPWAVPAFVKLKNTIAGRPLLYAGSSQDRGKVDSCIGMAIHKALRQTGITQDPTVKPLSIRNTFGRATYEAAGLEAAADALGTDDLMVVAREIGIRPHRRVDK